MGAVSSLFCIMNLLIAALLIGFLVSKVTIKANRFVMFFYVILWTLKILALWAILEIAVNALH